MEQPRGLQFRQSLPSTSVRGSSKFTRLTRVHKTVKNMTDLKNDDAMHELKKKRYETTLTWSTLGQRQIREIFFKVIVVQSCRYQERNSQNSSSKNIHICTVFGVWECASLYRPFDQLNFTINYINELPIILLTSHVSPNKISVLPTRFRESVGCRSIALPLPPHHTTRTRRTCQRGPTVGYRQQRGLLSFRYRYNNNSLFNNLLRCKKYKGFT